VFWVSVKATDSNDVVKTYHTLICIESKSNKPSGSTSGQAGVEYTYTAQATNDLLWDEVYYHFDWGDSSFSDALGPYKSNEPV
jgi:hypothetical protein